MANGVAADYDFWLGDAFASGGSVGYDHKAMGITARGGWEAVKRHFRELGKDIQSEPFTVIGIGDRRAVFELAQRMALRRGALGTCSRSTWPPGVLNEPSESRGTDCRAAARDPMPACMRAAEPRHVFCRVHDAFTCTSHWVAIYNICRRG